MILFCDIISEWLLYFLIEIGIFVWWLISFMVIACVFFLILYKYRIASFSINSHCMIYLFDLKQLYALLYILRVTSQIQVEWCYVYYLWLILYVIIHLWYNCYLSNFDSFLFFKFISLGLSYYICSYCILLPTVPITISCLFSIL